MRSCKHARRGVNEEKSFFNSIIHSAIPFLRQAGKAGMFDTWMMQESDAVQGSARAFAERLISERFDATIKSSQESLQTVLGQLYHLYLINIVERNLG